MNLLYNIRNRSMQNLAVIEMNMVILKQFNKLLNLAIFCRSSFRQGTARR